MNWIRFSLVGLGLATLSVANAAHITISALGITYDIECSEITVDTVLPGETWLTGSGVCEKVCDAVDDIEGWDCEFHGEYIIIDGPNDGDLEALFKSGTLELQSESAPKPTPTTSSVTTSRR